MPDGGPENGGNDKGATGRLACDGTTRNDAPVDARVLTVLMAVPITPLELEPAGHDGTDDEAPCGSPTIRTCCLSKCHPKYL